ncbi:ankyrin repeat domain-containing protein [Marispirochaeta sp.]|uniref:ankyrin repeat domain-containing protein n=1 Tax=Marispirochaeta sp. TaxID=2038653 RepID=UPI0029C6C56B|nr:ankyrin repeat domain-containing protein [Marispirochaeta sp.]
MKKYIYLLLIPLIILSCNKRRSETLKEAIYTGNLDDVKYFIENGADINALFSNGFSPLYIAVQLEHNDVVQYLLDNGAIINKVYKDDEYGGYSVML